MVVWKYGKTAAIAYTDIKISDSCDLPNLQIILLQPLTYLTLNFPLLSALSSRVNCHPSTNSGVALHTLFYAERYIKQNTL